MRTHKRLIDIIEPSADVMDSLMKLELPAGVDVEIKTIVCEVAVRSPIRDGGCVM